MPEKDLQRLILECDTSEDPEAWEALVRFLERKGYQGHLHRLLERETLNLQGIRERARLEKRLERIFVPVKEKGMNTVKERRGNPLHFRTIFEEETLCARPLYGMEVVGHPPSIADDLCLYCLDRLKGEGISPIPFIDYLKKRKKFIRAGSAKNLKESNGTLG